MKKIFSTILIIVSTVFMLNAQTQGELSVSVSTSEAGGKYSPRNVIAIWIENEQGNFIKTLLVYANKRKTHLNNWQASTAAVGSEYNKIDAISGATKSSHTTRNCSWDGTDYTGLIVADGKYYIRMELTDKNATGNNSSFLFTKGMSPNVQTPSNKPSFSSLSINWIPAVNQTPYGGSNRSIPGLIEAEHYDVGGEGFAYHDDDSKEGDINFRPNDYVDVVAKSSAGNDSVVSFIKEREWLEYTVDAEAGRYDITLFYFSGETGGDVLVSLYGEILDTINVPGNQGLDVLDSTSAENILLPEGGKDKILRLEFINNPAFDIDAIKFTRLFTPVSGISLNSCPSDTLWAGDTYQLTANVEPWYANNSSLTWESSDEAIATVDSTGMVTAISDGTAFITVTTNEGGFATTCQINSKIEVVSVYGITIGDCPWTILQAGNTHQLIANVAPENATDRQVTWKSSDPEVASVDENGLVFALSQGSVKITAITKDGGYTSFCNIGVMGNATSADYEEHINSRIKIYPNPVSDKLHVEFSKIDKNREIIIFDSKGQMIHKEPAGEIYKQIDITSLNTTGVLVVKIKTNNQCNVHKICVL
jgi:hypothetical protein